MVSDFLLLWSRLIFLFSSTTRKTSQFKGIIGSCDLFQIRENGRKLLDWRASVRLYYQESSTPCGKSISRL